MRVQPLTPTLVIARLTALIDGRGRSARLRVAVDGAPATRPDELADALVEPMRALGRPVVRVRATDFLRPASLRWEHGREDADALYDDWLDLAALDREVLTPLGPGGRGTYLPTLRDQVRDRSTRARPLPTPTDAVLVLDGALLLGRRLDLDLTVHLAARPATLARLTPAAEAWTLPAFARYAREVDPERVADVVVRVDDPRRPAMVLGPGAEPARADEDTISGGGAR